MSTGEEKAKPFNGAAAIEALKKIQENWLLHLELVEHQAKMSKARYDALLAQGFSEQQALYLCTRSIEL